MTSDLLSSVAGIILSLAFSYLPGVSDWFSGLDGVHKRLIMAGLLLVVAVGAFGLGCANVLGTVECSRDGALGLASAYISALIANQSAYQITKRRG